MLQDGATGSRRWLAPLCDIFVSLIRMCVIPAVFVWPCCSRSSMVLRLPWALDSERYKRA